METITAKDLINLGYPKNTAQNIIRQAKHNMVQQGYALYNNKRLGRVPKHVVEAILGVKLSDSGGFSDGKN